MNLGNIDVEGCWNISVDVRDAELFRQGEEPLPHTPLVKVEFNKYDIEDLEDEEGLMNTPENISLIKDKIIDWSARAAGGLDESEFFCTGINILTDNKGEIIGGETLFQRRYVL